MGRSFQGNHSHPLCRRCSRSHGAASDFRGYAEGKDLFSGAFDVVVTDGFTGNVVLKTAEGTAWAFRQFLKQSVERSALAKFGAMLMKPVFDQVRKKLDYAEYGGAPLVGCDGTAILAHGRSDARAIRNAIRAAAEAAGPLAEARDEIISACEQAAALMATEPGSNTA